VQEYKLLIGGRLVEGESEMDVLNPATEELLAKCPRASVAQFHQAIEAAHAAFPGWAATPIAARRAKLIELADLVNKNAAELARLLVQEQGKPLPEASAEIAYSEFWIRTMAGYDVPTKVIEDSESRKVEMHRRPLGVVGAIIPWNFPVLVVAFKLPFALLAGNTIVIKPAPTTPLTTLKFGELCQKVFPAGVVNIVTDNNDLGSILSSHPLVRKVSLTGSTETGRKVMASAAETIKRITLELGGNDAAIVLDDVDPKKIAPGIFAGAFTNAGQVCIALKRLYVHEDVYDEVCDELASLADAATVDDGLKQGTTMGPLQNRKQFEKVKAYLADAKANGRIIAGGEVMDRPGYFVRPTIVRDIKDGTKLVDEEQFGPILPVIKFDDAEIALQHANSSPMGLGGSIWSADTSRAYELATRMDAGTVWVNKHLDFGPTIPFGGSKQSGLGTEFAEEGLAEFTQVSVINVAK
jgi:acyl-CoA reductase-like NAD-dependent aldehyde dehydrogenase